MGILRQAREAALPFSAEKRSAIYRALEKVIRTNKHLNKARVKRIRFGPVFSKLAKIARSCQLAATMTSSLNRREVGVCTYLF